MKALIVLILFQSCVGAGDMFADKTKINEKYWLIENESGRYKMCYKTIEGYIERGPSGSRVTAYTIKDSLLVIKSVLRDSSTNFYVINMARDNGYSKDEEIFMDTIMANDYKSSWLSTLNLKLKPVRN